MIRHAWRMFAAATVAAATLLAPASPAAAVTGLTVAARFALLDDGDGSVILVGQYSCGPFPEVVPATGVIDLGIRQAAGTAEVVGIGYLTPTICDGQPQWYAAQLTATAGTFRRGPARWSASGYVEGSTGLQNVFVPPTAIRIR